MSDSTAGPFESGIDSGDPSTAEEVVPDSHAADVDAGFDDDDDSPTQTVESEDGTL